LTGLGVFHLKRMEFGNLPKAALAQIDFQLPADGSMTAISLAEQSKTLSPAYYVGCAKWGRPEWKGLIYPAKTKAADFLDEYLKQFNSIELNASFYRVPEEAAISSWKSKAEAYGPADFVFVPKFPKGISHFKKLRNSEESTVSFVTRVQGLGKYLGPCFLQLSDQFGPKDFDVLEQYLDLLPKDLQVFVELRNKDWFNDAGMQTKVFEMFRSHQVGTVITDTSGRRDLLHMELSTPEAFIRFEGNGKEQLESDSKRIHDWVARIKSWVENGLTRVYFFVHQVDEADTPALAAIAIEELNKQLDAGLKPVVFIS
jgi:uncharacterized protein YecE (DUF72 family)